MRGGAAGGAPWDSTSVPPVNAACSPFRLQLCLLDANEGENYSQKYVPLLVS